LHIKLAPPLSKLVAPLLVETSAEVFGLTAEVAFKAATHASQALRAKHARGVLPSVKAAIPAHPRPVV